MWPKRSKTQIDEKTVVQEVQLDSEQRRAFSNKIRFLHDADNKLSKIVLSALDELNDEKTEFWDQAAQVCGYESFDDLESQGLSIKYENPTGKLKVYKPDYRE